METLSILHLPFCTLLIYFFLWCCSLQRVNLSFDFPFYGHFLREITVATGGKLFSMHSPKNTATVFIFRISHLTRQMKFINKMIVLWHKYMRLNKLNKELSYGEKFSAEIIKYNYNFQVRITSGLFCVLIHFLVIWQDYIYLKWKKME